MGSQLAEVSTLAIFVGIMPLHENVKAIRLARDLRQLDLASAAGLSKSAYSKVERGQRQLTVAELHAIARSLGMSMDEVVAFDPEAPAGAPPPAPGLADAPEAERLRLLAELPPDDRETVFRVADQVIANHRFREFFAKHAA